MDYKLPLCLLLLAQWASMRPYDLGLCCRKQLMTNCDGNDGISFRCLDCGQHESCGINCLTPNCLCQSCIGHDSSVGQYARPATNFQYPSHRRTMPWYDFHWIKLQLELHLRIKKKVNKSLFCVGLDGAAGTKTKPTLFEFEICLRFEFCPSALSLKVSQMKIHFKFVQLALSLNVYHTGVALINGNLFFFNWYVFATGNFVYFQTHGLAFI